MNVDLLLDFLMKGVGRWTKWFCIWYQPLIPVKKIGHEDFSIFRKIQQLDMILHSTAFLKSIFLYAFF